jgi:outer membrane protein assembly factor BamB
MSDVKSRDPSDTLPAPASPTAVVQARPAPEAERRVRLWPGVIIVLLTWLVIVVPSLVMPGTIMQVMLMMNGPLAGAALFVVWWLFFSRIRWRDRGLILAACLAVGGLAYLAYDPTVGIYGIIMRALPTVMTAWVAWLLVTPFLRWPVRRAGLLLAFVLAFGYFALFRMDGVDGSFTAAMSYRWTPTAEQTFLAERARNKPATDTPPAAQPTTLQPGDWPAFRGPERDGRLPGVRIATDWKQTPPRQVWRQRVGPGWSSFAVVGKRLFTQEQRDQDEVVVCYDADTGTELWVHTDKARFTESVAGPGPRATPTFHEGRLYTLGAAGRLNCLEPSTGAVLWTRDIVPDSDAEVPTWGYAASPLIVGGVVSIFAGKNALAYNALTGDPAWSAAVGTHSYCSMHRAVLGGVEQVLIATDQGVTALEPAKGTTLWQHTWPVDGNMPRIVQPALVGDSDILIGTGFTGGTRRLHVSRQGSEWVVNEVWTTLAIKPYYNDLVVHKGHVYGFDGVFFLCVSLEDGKAKWKARGYGNGQVLLLPDQDVLLILSEKGAAALVEATPEAHKEISRIQAIEGKTWNHPVVAHGKLYVRNGEEAACYQLTEQDGAAPK